MLEVNKLPDIVAGGDVVGVERGEEQELVLTILPQNRPLSNNYKNTKNKHFL